MAWIESHQSLARHRKLLRVVAILKTDRHKAIGHLHELWWWGLDNATDEGFIGEVSEAEIAEAAGWSAKNALLFVGALVTAGFIEHHEDGYWLHDWEDYAGKLNSARALRRESNRKAQSARRQRLVSDDTTLTSATRQQHVSADNADSQHPTVPNRTQPNHTVDVADAAVASSSPVGDFKFLGDVLRRPMPSVMSEATFERLRRQRKKTQENDAASAAHHTA